MTKKVTSVSVESDPTPMVFVQHLGTAATKAHDVGVLTLAACERQFIGMNERGWPTLDRTWLRRLCQDGGRYAHFLFTPVRGA